MKFQIILKEIKALETNSNESKITIYKKIWQIESTEIWKKKTFYDNDELFQLFNKMSFKDFIGNAFNLGIIEFRNAIKILELNNGEELFTRWGRENMITYFHATPSERVKILETAEQSKVSANFGSIKQKLYPNKKPKKTEIENVWKAKYEKLLAKFNKLQKESQDEINNLKLAIQTIMGVVKEEKKANVI